MKNPFCPRKNRLLPALLAAAAMPVLAQQSAPSQAEDNVTNLPEVQVQAQSTPIARYPGGQIASGSRVGMLGDKDFMDTPFSTVSYTDVFIENIQARELADILAASDPTVFNSGMRGEFRESYSIRGFESNSADVQFNGLQGMAPFYRSPVEMLERVEILRGPSAMLGGMPPGGSVGGSVNLLPKRAGGEALTRLSTRYMSDAQWGLHTDVGRRFGGDGQFGIRFNGAYRDGEVAIKEQKKQMHLGSLALDWRGQHTRLFLDAYHTQDHIDGHSRGVSLAPGLTSVPKPPKADTPIAPTWSSVRNKDQAVTLRVEQEIADNISAYLAAGRSKAKYDSRRSPFGGTISNEAGDYVTTFGDLDNEYVRKSAQAGLNGRFMTGAVSHQWALNGNWYRSDGDESGFRHRQSIATNLYHPDWSQPIDHAPMMMPLFRAKARLSSYGIADTLGFIDDRLLVTAGVRRQQVKTARYHPTTGARTAHYDERATTPMAAVLFKINEQFSAYANYSQGLSEGATAPLGTANEGEMFAPFKTKQKEIGLKTDLGRFTHTVSLFEIKRPNSYTDVVSNIFSSGGEQRNRGVEWSFAGVTPLSGVRLLGGAAWLNAEVTQAATPALEGKQATGAPKIQGKLGVEWDTPFAPGLTLTANASHAAKQYITTDNSLHIPGRTIYGLGARYTSQVGSKPLTLRASISNLTNKAAGV